MQGFLIESALLTHGLPSISNDALVSQWDYEGSNIVWLEEGEIVLGDIEKFAKFRQAVNQIARVNYQGFANAVMNKVTCALTASGTIAVCEQLGISLAVTCGMGGLFAENSDEVLSSDIITLKESQVSLISTSPKDMFDINDTIGTITRNGREVIGKDKAVCNGYIFVGEGVELSKQYNPADQYDQALFLNPIDEEMRIQEDSILEEALQYAREEEHKGRHFQPAVNQYIDGKTAGRSSQIQYYSLLNNINFAQQIISDGSLAANQKKD